MTRARDLFRRIESGGDSSITQLIEQRTSEQLFLDFKFWPDGGDVRGILAKAISGFGNSEGGVVVWGVDCRSDTRNGDVATTQSPTENPEKFRSQLEGHISGCTVPPHSGVEHIVVKSSDGSSGYVVTHIPAAPNFPLQDSVRKQYYMRAGSNFEPVPHGVLASMFGRRPEPQIRHFWEVHQVTRPDFGTNTMSVLVSLRLINQGPSIAREPFASINVANKLGDKCMLRVLPVLNSPWAMTQHGRHYTTITEESYRLAPGGVVDLLNVELIMPTPSRNDLRLECTLGSNNAAPVYFVVNAIAEQLNRIRDSFLAEMPSIERYNQKTAKDYARRIFQISG